MITKNEQIIEGTEIKNIDWWNVGFKTCCWIIFIFLVVPVILVIPTAFTEGVRITFPPQGFSFKWFDKFFTSSIWVNSFKNSIIVATLTCVFSLGFGIPTALAFRHRFSGDFFVRLLIMLPWFVPEILLGIGLLMFVPLIGLYGSYLSIILAHTLWGMPITFIIISAGLSNVDMSVEEAARSLGASSARTFFEITAPLIKNAIVSAILFSFVLSLNEFMMAYFLCTPAITTLPINIWSLLRTGLSPVVAAASTIAILITSVELILISKFVGFQALY